MTRTDDHAWLALTAGKTHGINAVLLALASTHPDPAGLLREIEKTEQAGLATIEQTTMPDEYLDGMRDIIDRIRNFLRLRLEQL